MDTTTASSADAPQSHPLSVFRNWLSLAGLLLVIASLFSFLLLLIFDAMAPFANPYIGILTYLVAPGFLFLGIGITVLGAWLRRRQMIKTSGPMHVRIDFTRGRDRRIFGLFLVVSVVFLLISAVGSYRTYHFTESVVFCGEACHGVMKPELVAYRQSSHARVACAECHIGKGAAWYVRSKLSGTYQVYATLAGKYPRPIPTPVKNLRPAQETCEECHWPEKFVGNLDRTYTYTLSDETNTPFTVRMLLHVGGGDPKHGPTGGIHWHMNVANKVEYYTRDEARQKMDWVRMTDSQGKVTEFRAPKFTNSVVEAEVRRMDCIDCHNRPAHRYETPDDSVNQALALGRLDRSMPYIKTNAIFVLTRPYTNDLQAAQAIAAHLSRQYPNSPRLASAIEVIQQIYSRNFFPEMKANWKAYPENIGHKDWPGCFRCHDGQHKSADGKRTIKADDCTTCHTILAQGRGSQLDQFTPKGQKFQHPGGEADGACNECHEGTGP
jgi:nitrate/TMAO reductase-like tetraheme cytochrome c subunit